MSNIHISLTTISSRLPRVHDVIKSLLQQRYPAPFQIRLYLSKEGYLLDEGCPGITRELSRLERQHDNFTIHYVSNTGPYRKIIPLLNELYQAPLQRFMDATIITVDDDTIYPSNWLEGIMSAWQAHQCVVGYRGRAMTFNGDHIEPYKFWNRAISKKKSSANVLTGKDSILYQPHYFHPDVLDMKVALKIAPKADDLWLKVHTLLMGKPSFIINKSLDHEFDSVDDNSADISLYSAFNKKGGNDNAATRLDDYLQLKRGMSMFDLCQADIAG